MTGELNEDQIKAATAIACGSTREQAAAKAGVTRRTVSRWLLDPAFSGLVADARRELWHAAISKATTMVEDALETTRAIAAGEIPDAKISDRLTACRLILDTAGRVFDLDLESRITALETIAKTDLTLAQLPGSA